MVEYKVASFNSGVENKISPDTIKSDAAQDSLSWLTLNGKIALFGGRNYLGAQGNLGKNWAEILSPRKDGVRVHFRKISDRIQYFDGTNWQDTNITGLSATDYTFNSYISIDGAYMYATGPDGLFKFAVANPSLGINMYDQTKNYCGYSLVNQQRMFMWNINAPNQDKTALYLSYVDPQGSNINTSAPEVIAIGDGVTTSYSYTLTNGGGKNFVSGIDVYAPTGSPIAISGISKGIQTVITVGSTTGVALDEKVIVYGVSGMVEINNLVGNIVAITSTTITLDIDSNSFTNYSSGGHIAQVLQYKDNFNGVFNTIGGSVIYSSGLINVTFPTAPTNTVPIVVNYNYENSNNGGITDFTFSIPRTAGQGDIISQEFLGEPIQNVVIFQGDYYSMKISCAYKLTLSDDDTSATNIVYRRDIGIPSIRSVISTDKGIVFMNTANPSKPRLTMLQPSVLGTVLLPIDLTPLFAWENYDFSDMCIDSFDQFLLISAKQINSVVNDRCFLINTSNNYSTDIGYYGFRTTSKDDKGGFFVGDVITESIFQIFSGFDDLQNVITNYWTGKDDNYADERLKRYRYLRLKGLIQFGQYYAVYCSFDGGDFEQIGSVRWDGSYVDFNNQQTLGANVIGTAVIGGDKGNGVYPNVSQYFVQIRVRAPKFRTRTLKFVAQGIGYVDIDYTLDHDILSFEQKIPRRFRQKQHVNLDDTTVDNPTFTN